jgi:uncharacterized iron-regulated membrane protein
MKLRSILFWTHLVCGVTAGIVILIMSVTGTLLMYEKQMIAWADSRYLTGVVDAPRLPVETLTERIAAAAGGAPTSLTIPAAAAAPVLAAVRQRTVVVHPSTGAILGDSAPRLRRFFRVVTDWHRWLGMSGEQRAVARGITGWSNLIFLCLVVSGAYLWLPRVWSWRHVRAVAVFNGRLSGKARDFNWHNVIGIWSLVPLFFVVASAMPISFPWANTLLYKAVGEAPPAPQGRGAAPPATAANAGVATPGNASSGGARPVGTRDNGTPAAFSAAGLGAAWSRAERQVEGWRAITMRFSASVDGPVTFTIDRGSAGQPQYRGTLTVDRATGDTLRWEPFESQTLGRRTRSFSRFLHTGEVFGLTGQTIAGIASAGGAVLVWTGLALAWRRFCRRSNKNTDVSERIAA